MSCEEAKHLKLSYLSKSPTTLRRFKAPFLSLYLSFWMGTVSARNTNIKASCATLARDIVFSVSGMFARPNGATVNVIGSALLTIHLHPRFLLPKADRSLNKITRRCPCEAPLGPSNGRTPALRLDDLPRKCPSQVKRAPRSICWNVLGAQREQKQRDHAPAPP